MAVKILIVLCATFAILSAFLFWGMIVHSRHADEMSRDLDEMRGQFEAYRLTAEKTAALDNELVSKITDDAAEAAQRIEEVSDAIDDNPEWGACVLPADIQRVCSDMLSAH